MQAKGWKWTLEASFLEVYQEQIRDLLLEVHSADNQPIHAILQDEARGPSVSNVTVVNVDSIAQIQRLMAKAAKHRSVGQTNINAVSSRSHAIFALYLRGENAELDTELTGALHMVDLAGSERLSKSKATGSRMKETCSINKSLSCLTDVFAAKQEEARGERSHIPFRNSKLTHLLEPCLSGHGKTLMVLNVAPEEAHAHESLCSLRFASHVAQCNTGGQPKRNAFMPSAIPMAHAKSGIEDVGRCSRILLELPAGQVETPTVLERSRWSYAADTREEMYRHDH